MEVQFKKIAGDDGEISLEEFKSALGVKQVRMIFLIPANACTSL